MPKWRKWQPIDSVYMNMALLGQPGIYKIRMVDKDGKPIPINRIGGIDLEGIIYIGQSVRLRERIEDFIRGSHSGGRTYKKMRKRLRKHKPYQEHYLQFSSMNCTRDRQGKRGLRPLPT